MDCREARLQLDVIRDNGPEHDDPSVHAAELHVATCEECAAAVESRRVLDREIAQRIQAVEVPAGLKSRLLNAVQEPEPVARKSDTGIRRRDRRRILVWSLGSAALIAVGLAGFHALQPRAPRQLEVAEVQQWWQDRANEHDDLALNDLPDFDGAFAATIEDNRWAHVVDQNLAKGVDLDGDGRHDLVVYPLQSAGLQGALLLTAPNRVADLPTATSALAADKPYAPLPHVTWRTDDERLCVCVVTSRTRQDPLRLLLDAVYSRFG